MIDVGPDIKELRDKNRVTKLGKKMLQKEFMKNWLMDHQDYFAECMEAVRKNSPSLYVKLYLQAQQQIMPKQQDLNVKFGIEKDFADVMMLAKTKSSDGHELPLKDNYVQFDVMKEPNVVELEDGE